MKRRIFVTLLAFCLIASLCVFGAAASGTETGGGIASITSGGTTASYETAEALATGIASAQDDAVVNILDSFEVEYNNGLSGGYFNITKDIIINGNGHTITVTGSSTSNIHIFNAVNADVEISGLNINGSGIAQHGIQIYGGTATISGVTSINNKGYGLLVNGSSVTASDLTTSGNGWGGVNVNGRDDANATFEMTSGDLSGDQASVVLDSKAGSTNDVTLSGGTYNTVMVNTPDSSNNDRSAGIDNLTITGGSYVNVAAYGVEENSADTVLVTGATVTGEVSKPEGSSAPVSVINADVSAVSGDVVVVNGGGVEDTAPDGVVAVIGTKQYKDLEDALEEAGDEPVTIELVANANMVASNTDYIVSKRDTVINGNGHTINITVDPNDKFDSTRDKMLQFDGATLTLNNVTLNITGQNDGDGTYRGDAIDLINEAHLYANDSFINIKDVGAGFVIETTGEDIVLTNTDVTVENVNGNGSQGGEWTVNGSSLSFTNCGDHGLSVETLVATNSLINVDDADKLALFGSIIDLNSTEVDVTNSGSELPVTDGYAATLGGYYSPVQVKGIATEYYLSIDAGSSITVTNSHNGNNTVYLPDGAELINNGTINATVTVPEDSDMCVVVFMADGAQYDVQIVDSGDSVRVPTLSKNGYTFVGWRVNNSNTIVKGGESYPITANTTFTAVWNMINIPDTYEISVISSDGGTVEASLSNASAGSVITLTVTPDEGYELAYITVDGERFSGTSFVMPDHAVEVRAVFTEIGAEMNFVDVNTGDWFYDAVEYVYTNGLMEGTSTRTFEPNATMTRAMFWTVLARIDGETITGDNWKTLAQNWAVSSGISDGTNADGLITREQMVTMLYRFANSPEAAATGFGQFTDGASVSDWAVDAMAWALDNGVITGMGDGILSPAGSATRAQAAAMLMRFVEA